MGLIWVLKAFGSVHNALVQMSSIQKSFFFDMISLWKVKIEICLARCKALKIDFCFYLTELLDF